MSEKKTKQLEMNFSTASGRLRKTIMFHLIEKLDENWCYRCGGKIESADDLSTEHKISWLDSDNPKELFFDLENIAFSHKSCNYSNGRRKRGLKHPSQESYKRGCRCNECKEIEKLRRRKQRKQGIKT